MIADQHSKTQLAEIQKALVEMNRYIKRAEPAPWKVDEDGVFAKSENLDKSQPEYSRAVIASKDGANSANAARDMFVSVTGGKFITKARTDMPALLESVEYLLSILEDKWADDPESISKPEIERLHDILVKQRNNT